MLLTINFTTLIMNKKSIYSKEKTQFDVAMEIANMRFVFVFVSQSPANNLFFFFRCFSPSHPLNSFVITRRSVLIKMFDSLFLSLNLHGSLKTCDTVPRFRA